MKSQILDMYCNKLELCCYCAIYMPQSQSGALL